MQDSFEFPSTSVQDNFHFVTDHWQTFLLFLISVGAGPEWGEHSFTLWDVKTTSLGVLPCPIPGVIWVQFHPLPAELLSASGALQGPLRVFRRASHCPTAQKDSPIYWGHINPSDQSITWLSNAFLLQSRDISPLLPLGVQWAWFSIKYLHPWDFTFQSYLCVSRMVIAHFRVTLGWGEQIPPKHY